MTTTGTRPPELDEPGAAALAADLEPFGVAALEDLLGPVAAAALHREQPVAARRAVARRTDPLAVLADIFLLGGTRPTTQVEQALPRLGVAGARRAALLETAGEAADDAVRALVDLRPYAADDAAWWLASDLGEVATGGPLRRDHVLGVGGASTTLASWTPRRPVARALDLGTGSGVQALHAARHASSVVATDVSARALAFARFTARLNAAREGGPFAGRTLDLRRGDLLEPVAGETFDLVVSNPPFVITPRVAGVPHYEYRDGGRSGDDVVRRLVSGVADHLAPGGVAQLLGNWEHRDGDWRERVGGWLPDGVQAWVVQREVQDPAQYAETWSRDGGHRPGAPEHDALVAAWLDDFAARGIQAVGFGVVTLRRPADGGPTPHRLDDVRGPLAGPRGEVVTAVLDAEDWLARTSDDELLAARLLVAPDVTEERHGAPGAADPQVVLLRQGGGLGRAVRVGTELAGLVGACDGELSVGQVVGALGVLLDQPVDALRADLLPDVRRLVADLLLGVAPAG